MKISTEVKTFVILSYTGVHHFITDEQEKALRTMSNTGKIFVNRATVFVKDIGGILPIDKYYETFPEKKVDPTVKTFYSNKNYCNLSASERLNLYKRMAKEMKKYIASSEYQGTQGPLNILETYNKKINQLEREIK
jgi:predicted ferric reductase